MQNLKVNFSEVTGIRIFKHQIDKLVLALPRKEQAQGKCPYVYFTHTLNGDSVAH